MIIDCRSKTLQKQFEKKHEIVNLRCNVMKSSYNLIKAQTIFCFEKIQLNGIIES